MANAKDWVRQIIIASQAEPMSTEAVLKSLERYAGQGEKMLSRVRELLEYLDEQLIARNNGPVMRDLWSTVAFYLEKVEESQAAA